MPPSATPSESDPFPDTPTGARLRRWGRRALWTLGGLIGTTLLLAGLLLLGLQTNAGATAAARFLAGHLNPIPHTELTIERASGNWIHSLRLTNVTLTRTDSSSGPPVPMAHVDTIAVRYRLGALLRGRVHLTSATISGPSVTMRQAPDSTWDWLRLLPEGESASAETSTTPIHVDRLRLFNGSFTADFYAGSQDSTARIRDLVLRARSLHVASSIRGHLDTLGLQGHLPADTTTLRLAARGALSSTRLRVDTLRLTSPRSRVWGHGTARLPTGPTDSLEDVALTLRATPLVFGDLTAFLPTLGLAPQEAIHLRATLTGSTRRLTLDAQARFSGGGHLTVHATGTPRIESSPGAAPLRYELDADIHRLTTSLIGPLDAAQNTLTATVSGTLHGPTLPTLDGTVTAHVTDTRLYDVRASTVTLKTTVENGTASVDLQGTLNGTTLSVRGTAHPFDAPPSMDLTAHIRDLSLSTVVPAAGIRGTLAATAHIQGHSLTPETATYDVALTVAPSRIGVQPIEGGHFSFALRPDQLRFDGRLTFPVGRIQAAGHVALDGSERFALETGRFEAVNAAALVGDTTASRVTGTLQAQGRGFLPETMQGRATLTIQDAHYGPHRMTSLKTMARLDDGRLTAETSAQLNGSAWTLAATGRPFAPVPSAEITRGRFQNVDIGAFFPGSSQSRALHGTFQGRVQGATPATLRLEAGLTLDTSRVNRQRISSASVDVSIREGTLRSTLTLRLPEGAAHASVQAHPFQDVPSYRLAEGTFDALDVGALAGISRLTTQLSGSLTLRGTGTRLSTLTLHSELALQGSTVNQTSLSEGRLTLAVDSGRVTTNGQFSVAGGSVQLRGRLTTRERLPSYTLQASAQSLDVGALAGLDTLQAHLDAAQWTLKGQGTVLEHLTASTRLSVSSARVGRLRIGPATVAGTLERGLLTVDTLSIQSNVLTGRGQGPLALLPQAGQSNFDFQASIADADPLRPILDVQRLRVRKGTVDLHVYGTAEQQRFDGSATLDGVIYEDLRLGNAQLLFNGERGTAQFFRRLEVEGMVDYLSVSGFTANRVRLDARYDGTTVELATKVRLDPRHKADLEASFRPDAGPVAVHLHRLNMQLGPDRWSLLQPATITIGDGYRIDQLLLHSGAQQIAADGVVSPTGPQSLLVTAEAVQLGSIAPLMGVTGLEGTLTGMLSFTGAASHPQIDGRLDLTIQSEGRRVGTLHLDAEYQDLAVTLDARLTHTDGSVLTATGSVPADFRLRTPTAVELSTRPIRLEASTDRFPINWIDPFLDPSTLRSVTGTLTGNVTVRGTPNQPQLTGTASVSNAGAYLPSLATTYRNGTLALSLKNDQITLENAILRSQNGGVLRAHGVVNFPKLTVGQYNLTLTASDFLAIDTRAYRRAIIDGQTTLRGTLQRPTLTGTVEVKSGSVYYSEALAESGTATTEVSLSPQARLTLEERFGLRLTAADTTTFDVYEASSLDLSIHIQRNTRLRSTSNPEMNIRLTGNLDVQKSPYQEPRVFGTIHVVEERSTVRQFGQKFQITEGSLTFNGDPYTPYITLTAVYEQRARGTQGTEVRITLSLSGRPSTLSPSLSSEPPMSTRNILSYLATGRPASELFTGSPEKGSLATQVALGQASNFVENLAASELGLDVVRLQVHPEGVSYLTVGRYLTPRFFLSVEQPLVTSSVQSSTQPTALVPEVTLEYQLTDYLLLRSLTNRQSLQLNLLFEYAY